MIRGRRLLITGGAGFIGSSLTSRIIDRNEVTVFDTFARDALSALPLRDHPHLHSIEGDVCDPDAIAAAIPGHDVVVHCAAIAGIDTVGQLPVQTMRVNVLGSANVLQAAAETPEVERVVCFSTSEVLGTSAFEASETSPAVIGPAGVARWTYATGKLAEEHFALAYHHETGLPTTVVRPFNVYGPGQVGEGAIRNLTRAAVAGDDLVVNGDGTQIRAWTYVDDFLDGLEAAIQHPDAVGEVFNLGNPRAVVTVLELARSIVRVTGSSSRIVHGPPLDAEVQLRVPNIDKARAILGFEPRVDLEEGIRRTAASVSVELAP